MGTATRIGSPMDAHPQLRDIFAHANPGEELVELTRAPATRFEPSTSDER